MKDGNLVLNVPGQLPYPLENIGGRRYKFAGNAPAGYFVTFRPAENSEGKTEMFLEQPPPKKDVTLTKIKAKTNESAAKNETSEKYKDLTGNYETQVRDQKMIFQLVVQNGKLSVLRPGQSSLTLVEKSKDTFSIAGAPDTYEITVKRSESGEATALSVRQPNGNIEMQRVEDFKAPFSTEELMTRIINALGGEANLRKYKTLETTVDINLINQGITGTGVISEKAPNLKSTRMEFYALGKRLGTMREYFNGATGGTDWSFMPDDTESEKELAQERADADFYAPVNWRDLYKTIVIKGATKIGDEDAYIVVKMPENGSPITDYISTKKLLAAQARRFIRHYNLQ